VTPEAAPRVSVVIPNYWDGDLVLETLRSIQEDEPIEVVVVDDCSPAPDTMDKLEHYAATGLVDVLLQQPRNMGVAAALNRGVEAATGRYVWILGNDDLLLPGVLGRMADELDSDPTLAFAVGGYRCFGARTSVFRPAPWDPWALLYRNLWPGCMMVRRDTYLEVGGNEPGLTFHDWEFYWRLAGHGSAGFVTTEVVYRYRVHDGGRLWASTRRYWAREYARVRALHPGLYERATRRRLRAASPLPWWRKAWLYGTAQTLRAVPPPVAEAIFTVVQGFDAVKRRRARRAAARAGR